MTKAAAQKQMAALYANEPAAHLSASGPLPASRVAKGIPMADHPTDNLIRSFTTPAAASVREAGENGDGRTLFGHFAVFDRWTEIDDWFEGRFLERIASGAFKRTFKERRDQIRVLYDHGHDPQLGNKPLGGIRDLREDGDGAYYEVSLIDASYNDDFIIPAAREGLLGASFRFKVTGEEWVEPSKATRDNPAKLAERTITDVDLYEFGPVTFPAYAEATAGVRSATGEFLDRLMSDPVFVARFTARVGLTNVEPVLTAALPAHPLPTPSRPDSPPTPVPTAVERSEDETTPPAPQPPQYPTTHDARKARARQIEMARKGIQGA